MSQPPTSGGNERRSGDSTDDALARTRKYSLREAAAASVMSGTGDAYVIPFAVALQASAAQVGFLSSVVGLLSALGQVAGSRLVYRFRRKTLMLVSSSTQAFLWLGVAGLAAWAGAGAARGAILGLLGLYAVMALAASLGGPAWFSLMGDVVSPQKRGRYFSHRNRVAGMLALAATVCAALVLDAGKHRHAELYGFGLLFLIAFAARAVSAGYLARHVDPPLEMHLQDYFSFWQFLTQAPRRNFGRFTLYVGLINLATHFSAPFFAVYMLRDLHYSYLWLSAVNLSGGLFSVWSMPLWGRLGDRYGNRRLLWLGSLLIPFPPLFWLVSGNPLFLIFTAQLLAGAGWAAFNLAASNFIYDAVSPPRRALCVSYYTMVNGLAMFVGASAGGLFADHVRVPFLHPLLFIFLISSALRAAFAAGLLRFVREVRPVETLHLRAALINQLYLLGPRPMFGMFRGMRTLLFNRLWPAPGEAAASAEEPGE